ncbi:MAG: aminotransferase class V-fold PLP-dependent enzyme [Verrucomicrobiae bacterium]|nr:aminotransferase class V-fold PLP-dependent enzyme [Verrucomicrobiae bacterium]
MEVRARDVIYLDNNATTQVAPEVFEAMVPFLTDLYGNPSSVYTFGSQVAKAVEAARERVAALIRCAPQEVIFTSCGTESDNTAIRSAIQTTGLSHIVTTRVEHSAVIRHCAALEKSGHAVTWLDVGPSGILDPAQVERAIRRDTAIVSVMAANNETGVLFPVEEIADICRARGVLFHTDAVQMPGRARIDLSLCRADFLSLSGHKFHAPKGIGALFVRRGVPFASQCLGGGQEKGRRAGTENTPAIAGLGRAAELAMEDAVEKHARMRRLRDRLETSILALIPGTRVNGDPSRRLPNTSNITFDRIEAESLLLELGRHGICASTGSACVGGSPKPSHVLTAMGLNSPAARGAVRFSLSDLTTEAEIDRTLGALPPLVKKLRAVLPPLP